MVSAQSSSWTVVQTTQGTVVQTATTIIGETRTSATPFPTSSPTCVDWECTSTSCIPATTSLLLYLCEPTCLRHSTFTYSTVTYPPPVTQTIPCNGKFAKKDGFDELERRYVCALDTTITNYTSMACTDCTQFPTLTTYTKSIIQTIYKSCDDLYTTPPPSSTRTSTSTKTTKTRT